MNKKPFLIGMGALGLLVAVVAWFYSSFRAAPQTAQTGSFPYGQTQAHRPVTQPPGQPDHASPSLGRTAWLLRQDMNGKRAASGSEAGPEAKMRAERIAKMKALRERLERAGKEDRDPEKVEALLLELEKINGSPRLSGVRLDVLRQNMAIIRKIQKENKELETLQKTFPADKPLTPQQLETLQARMRELGQLQKQLRTDVMDSSAAAPSRNVYGLPTERVTAQQP